MLATMLAIATKKLMRMYRVFHHKSSERTEQRSFSCSSSSSASTTLAKSRIVAEHRPHHEGDEQDRDIGLKIALADRIGIARDQAAVRLSGIGGGLVRHPSAGQSIKGAWRTRPFALILG